jgi:hypothetical protein
VTREADPLGYAVTHQYDQNGNRTQTTDAMDLPRLRGHFIVGGDTLGKESTMGRTRSPYPPEFRAEAVRLVRESGKSSYRLAKDLGVAEQSLRNWVKHADLDSGRRMDGLTTEERGGTAAPAPRESGLA